MRRIKKYANRKMYDTKAKSYISMDRLGELIKSGEDVEIIDNTTGETITSSIVSRLLAMDEGARDKAVSSGIVTQLLRKGGGTITDYAKKYASLWQGALNMAEDEVDRLVSLLIKDKELSKTEGTTLKKEILGYTDSLKRWISESIDKKVSEMLDVVNLATRNQMKDISARLDTLEKKVKKIEGDKAGTRAKIGKTKS